MRYDLSNEYDVNNFRQYCKSLLQKGCWVDVKRVQENRTSPQNKYLHLILGWFACEYGYTLEEVKIDYYKRLCNPYIFIRERVNKHGRVVRFLRSTTELTVDEMTTSIERFRNYSATNGLYLPSPEEKGFLLHIEREIEKNKEYM